MADDARLSVGIEMRLDRINSQLSGLNRSFYGSMRRIDQDVERTKQRVNGLLSGTTLSRDAGRLSATLKQTFAGVAAGAGVAGLTRLADGYTRYTNQLKVAGLEGQNLEVVQEKLFGIAQKYGVELESLGGLYGRLSQAGRELGATDADLIKFTNGVAAAIKVQGGSTESARGALTQLTQALGGEIVRAEEFNSINEGARPILQAVANGIDRYRGSVSALRRDVIEGKVSSKEFYDAFLQGSADLEAQATKANLTIAASLQILNDALGKYIGETDQSLSATQRVSQGIQALADNVDKLVPALAVIAAGVGLRTFGPMTAEAIKAAAAVAALRIQNELGTATLLSSINAIRQKATAAAATAAAEAEAAASHVIGLQAEAAKIRENILLTQQLLAVENQRRGAALGKAGIGLGGVVAGGPQAAAQAAAAAADAERNRLMQGLAASSQTLQRTEKDLAAATAVSAAASTKAAAAQTVAAAAIGRTTIAARVGAGAMGLLNASTAWMGGPWVALAVAFGAALLWMAKNGSEAAKEARALESAHSKLDPILQTVKASLDAAATSSGKLRDEHLAAADAATILASKELDSARKVIAASEARIAAIEAERKARQGSGKVTPTADFLANSEAQSAQASLEVAQAELRAAQKLLEGAGLGKTRGSRGRGTTFVFDSAEEQLAKRGGGGGAAASSGKPGKDPRDKSQERGAQVEAALAGAERELLQALADLNGNVRSRAELEKQIIDQALTEEKARLDKLRADITDDKGLTEPRKAELIAQVDLAKTKAEEAARARKSLVDRDLANQLNSDATEIAAAQIDAEIAGLEARREITRSVADRIAIERRIADLAEQRERAEIDSALAVDGLADADRKVLEARLGALNASRDDRQAATDRRERAALAQEALTTAMSAIDAEAAILGVQRDLATTLRERRSLELRLFDLAEQRERAEIAAALSAEDLDAANEAALRKRLETLDETLPGRREAVSRANEGPAAALRRANEGAEAFAETAEDIGVRGFNNLADGLAQATAQAEDLGDVARNVFQQMATDLLAASLKQAGVAALSFIPGFAGGTQSAPGGLAYVHRDELINLPKGSRVTPSHLVAAAQARQPAQAAPAVLQIFQPLYLDAKGAVMTETLVSDLNRFAVSAANSAATRMGRTVLKQTPAYLKSHQMRQA